jgi:AcrR family transcriptional regulator
MSDPRPSSENTRAEILRAARQLFATRGIDQVTVRDIAADAGVTHALVHRYFGTKEEIVSEIIRREVLAASRTPVAPDQEGLTPLEIVRRMLLYGLTDARNTLLLIARAELAGLEPEKMLDGEHFRPIGLMADWLKQQQAQGGTRAPETPDAALVSAVVGGAVFSMQLLAPWLMAAVGLRPEDAVERREEIVDILMGLVTRAAGAPAEQSPQAE